ncbi:hypothetical protein [Alkalilimnicola ehrlichii]|uniref:Uncharacterized protein n=1 Tax=Alkalilimnicola ehrlichii TaxID=351052 RepID=A0A3E0WVZ0_9GAMM|nr:hypothetical protein [Alkalilimnicola ehrlichii]RFA36166.1 hypothetical protein CAL65_12020 [Alkalilimnicola ehrlichii]
MQTKLDRLAPIDRRALRTAAAMGQRFSLDVLTQLLEQPDYEPVLPASYCLVRPAEPGVYMFVHDLILQGVYELTEPALRRRLHLRLAEHYTETDKALCARHLHKAEVDRAPAMFVAAIQEKLAAYQYEAALELCDQCASIAYAPVDTYSLAMLAAEAKAKMGLMQEARDYYERALAAAGEEGQRLQAVIGLARALNVLEEIALEERLLDEAAALADKVGAYGALAEIYYLKGNIFFPRGDFRQCRYFHDLARQYARRAESIAIEALALSGLGDSYYAEGRMPTALVTFQQCVELCERHGFADIEASNRFMVATADIYANNTEAALREAIASAELGRRVGNLRAEIVSRLTAGWLQISLGNAEGAEQQVQQGLALARTMGAARFEAFLLESVARVRVLQGRDAEAQAAVREAWRIVEQQGLYRFIGPWVLGTLAVLEDDTGKRQAALRKAEALLAEGCVGHNYYRFYVAAAEACLVYGEPERAVEYAEHLAVFTAAEPCPWADHHVELIRRYAAYFENATASARQRLEQQWQAADAAGIGRVMTRLALRQPWRSAVAEP